MRCAPPTRLGVVIGIVLQILFLAGIVDVGDDGESGVADRQLYCRRQLLGVLG